MLKMNLEDDIVEISLERRVRLRLFETINSKRAAHLIIDMQTGFMTPEAPAEIAPAVSIPSPSPGPRPTSAASRLPVMR